MKERGRGVRGRERFKVSVGFWVQWCNGAVMDEGVMASSGSHSFGCPESGHKLEPS